MRALVIGAVSDDLSGTSLRDVPTPARSAGHVLVRMRAAALNYPDLLMTRGRYQLKPDLPFIPGMEMAGEVVDAPTDGPFRPGDRVVGSIRLGALAEYICCAPSALRRIPPQIDDVVAASIGTAYLTAYVALVRLAAVSIGEWVLIHGASGGVGLAAVDVAQALGARTIATSRSARKRDAIDSLLAPDAVLPAVGFRDDVLRLTGGGAAVVVDTVGGETFTESTRCIAFGGRLLVVGFTGGIATLSTNIPLIKGFSVIGVRAGEYGRQFPARGQEDRDAIWTLAAAGRLRPRVDSVLPLDEWRTGFESLMTSRHVGKIVLVP